MEIVSAAVMPRSQKRTPKPGLPWRWTQDPHASCLNLPRSCTFSPSVFCFFFFCFLSKPLSTWQHPWNLDGNFWPSTPTPMQLGLEAIRCFSFGTGATKQMRFSNPHELAGGEGFLLWLAALAFVGQHGPWFFWCVCGLSR